MRKVILSAVLLLVALSLSVATAVAGYVGPTP
jgi:hypothetical protein